MSPSGGSDFSGEAEVVMRGETEGLNSTRSVGYRPMQRSLAWESRPILRKEMTRSG